MNTFLPNPMLPFLLGHGQKLCEVICQLKQALMTYEYYVLLIIILDEL